MERVTVYLNEIPVSMIPWMEVRHVVYSRQIPFEERDAVVGGSKIIQDSNGKQVLLEDKIIPDEHYSTTEAREDSVAPALPELSQVIKSFKISGFGKSTAE